MTPVFSWSKKAYMAEQLVCIPLGQYSEERLCISQPVNISHNVTFLVQTSHLKHPDDIKCDGMGSWKHNGSPKHFYCVNKSTKGITNIEPLKPKPPDPAEDIYELKRVYYQTSSDETIRKLVAKLEGTH